MNVCKNEWVNEWMIRMSGQINEKMIIERF